MQKPRNHIIATQKSQQRSPENTNARRNREQRKNPEIASQHRRNHSNAGRNRDFWVWIFAPIEIVIWVWDFEKWI